MVLNLELKINLENVYISSMISSLPETNLSNLRFILLSKHEWTLEEKNSILYEEELGLGKVIRYRKTGIICRKSKRGDKLLNKVIFSQINKVKWKYMNLNRMDKL